MGSENEWAITVFDSNNNPAEGFFDSSDFQFAFMNRCIPAECIIDDAGVNRFLANGARVYFDTGNHMEYATPEVVGAREVVKYQCAGDRIIERAVAAANEFWRDQGYTFRSYKNNCDTPFRNKGTDNTYGHHENYLVPKRHYPMREEHGHIGVFHSLIGPFIVTRQLFSGNGWIEARGDRLGYSLSQRAEKVTDDINPSSTSHRPVFHTKNEPHADDEKYFRLHFILSDAMISECAIFLTFGLTDMMLEAVSDRFLRVGPCGESPNLTKALWTFSRDPSLQTKFEFEQGKRYTVVNVQEIYRDCLRRFYETRLYPDPERQKLLDLWDRVIEAARSPRPHEALAWCAGWAAKQCVIEKDMARRGYGWDSNPTQKLGSAAEGSEVRYQAKAVDFRFDENHSRGYGRRLKEAGDMERIVADEEIESAMVQAPPTRAKVRVRVLQELAKQQSSKFIDKNWGSIKRGQELVFLCSNPYHAAFHLPQGDTCKAIGPY